MASDESIRYAVDDGACYHCLADERELRTGDELAALVSDGVDPRGVAEAAVECARTAATAEAAGQYECDELAPRWEWAPVCSMAAWYLDHYLNDQTIDEVSELVTASPDGATFGGLVEALCEAAEAHVLADLDLLADRFRERATSCIDDDGSKALAEATGKGRYATTMDEQDDGERCDNACDGEPERTDEAGAGELLTDDGAFERLLLEVRDGLLDRAVRAISERDDPRADPSLDGMRLVHAASHVDEYAVSPWCEVMRGELRRSGRDLTRSDVMLVVEDAALSQALGDLDRMCDDYDERAEEAIDEALRRGLGDEFLNGE